MLTLIGLLTIVLVVSWLLSSRVLPVVALALVPFAGALLAGFSLADLTRFYAQGLGKVAPVAAMFVFAVTFFGVMQDTGIFRPLIRGLLRLTGGNVIGVAIGTALLGMLAHLDGAGATTFLMTIPVLLPLYRELRMNPYLMLMLLALGAGIFNMLPWAGPLGRIAAVTDIDITALWRPLIPVQVAGAVMLVALAAWLGWRETRRIARLPVVEASGGDAAGEQDGAGARAVAGLQAASKASETSQAASGDSLLRPHLAWANAAIALVMLAMLVTGALPAAYIFMLGLAVMLPLNYRGREAQAARVAAHASSALSMGIILLASGAFLGVLDGSGMLTSIAADIVTVMPAALVPYLHLVIGVFGLPLELILSTDAYYFGLLPVINEVMATHGIAPEATIYALTIGNIVGTFISPFSPALWLALGLAGLEIGRHIRYSMLWMWGFSLALLGVAGVLGYVTVTA